MKAYLLSVLGILLTGCIIAQPIILNQQFKAREINASAVVKTELEQQRKLITDQKLSYVDGFKRLL